MVEQCRLGTGERLTKYLTVMNIIAWRIFYYFIIWVAKLCGYLARKNDLEPDLIVL